MSSKRSFVSSSDCQQFDISQTSRPLIKRTKEHEACKCLRLDNHTDTTTGNIKSAPTKHGRDTVTEWKATSIPTTCGNKGQLKLLEHAVIKTLSLKPTQRTLSQFMLESSPPQDRC